MQVCAFSWGLRAQPAMGKYTYVYMWIYMNTCNINVYIYIIYTYITASLQLEAPSLLLDGIDGLSARCLAAKPGAPSETASISLGFF